MISKATILGKPATAKSALGRVRQYPSRKIRAQAQDESDVKVQKSKERMPIRARRGWGPGHGLGPYSGSRLPSIMQDMQRDMDMLTKGIFGSDLWSGFEEQPFGDVMADFEETKTGYIIKADVPGMVKEDIKLTINQEGILSISGERKHEATEEQAGIRSIERSYGKFQRSFQLPKAAKTDDVSAVVENGVLTVNIGKKPQEEIGVRTISID